MTKSLRTDLVLIGVLGSQAHNDILVTAEVVRNSGTSIESGEFDSPLAVAYMERSAQYVFHERMDEIIDEFHDRENGVVYTTRACLVSYTVQDAGLASIDGLFWLSDKAIDAAITEAVIYKTTGEGESE